MSTCPNCGDSFKPANSDHLPFCGQGCLLSSLNDMDELRDRVAELSARNAELTAEIAELRGTKLSSLVGSVERPAMDSVSIISAMRDEWAN